MQARKEKFFLKESFKADEIKDCFKYKLNNKN